MAFFTALARKIRKEDSGLIHSHSHHGDHHLALPGPSLTGGPCRRPAPGEDDRSITGKQGDSPKETKSRANFPSPGANQATTSLSLGCMLTLRSVQNRRGLLTMLGHMWVANCLQARAKSPRGWAKGGMDSEEPEIQLGLRLAENWNADPGWRQDEPRGQGSHGLRETRPQLPVMLGCAGLLPWLMGPRPQLRGTGRGRIMITGIPKKTKIWFLPKKTLRSSWR